MSHLDISHRGVSEPVPTYVVDSWDRLDQLPFAHRPGRFSITYFPDEGSSWSETEEAFEVALADAVRRGRPRWLEIRASEGGVVTARQMATLLGVSRQAVDQGRRAGRLLAFQDGGREYLYPVWQLQDGRPLSGLERVLAALRAGEHDPKSQFIFFLSTFPRLWDRRPLDYLREGTENAVVEVEGAASGYLEQGAA